MMLLGVSNAQRLDEAVVYRTTKEEFSPTLSIAESFFSASRTWTPLKPEYEKREESRRNQKK